MSGALSNFESTSQASESAAQDTTVCAGDATREPWNSSAASAATMDEANKTVTDHEYSDMDISLGDYSYMSNYGTNAYPALSAHMDALFIGELPWVSELLFVSP